MKLYTVEHQGKTLVCLEASDGKLAVLPYETMNHLLTDDSVRRQEILTKTFGQAGTLSLETVTVLAPIPNPRQDVICLGMNYQKHKTEAEQFDAQAFTRERPGRSTSPSGPPTARALASPSPATLTLWTAWTTRPSWLLFWARMR